MKLNYILEQIFGNNLNKRVSAELLPLAPSWFYTILTDDYNIYIEEWLDDSNDVCVTVIGNYDKSIRAFDGNMNEVIIKIKKFLNENSK